MNHHQDYDDINDVKSTIFMFSNRTIILKEKTRGRIRQ